MKDIKNLLTVICLMLIDIIMGTLIGVGSLAIIESTTIALFYTCMLSMFIAYYRYDTYRMMIEPEYKHAQMLQEVVKHLDEKRAKTK